MILLYAVARESVSLDSATGLDGRSLFTIAAGDVALVADERDRAPAATETETLLAFGNVVQSLADRQPVLPVRFGTVLEDRDAARQHLETNADQWLAGLSRVTGHVELAVRARAEEPGRPSVAAPAVPSGREYLMTRVRAVRHAEAVRSRILDRVEADCRATRSLGDGQAVKLALLVHREEAATRVRGALRDLAVEEPSLELSCTGPWPPYSFSEGDAAW